MSQKKNLPVGRETVKPPCFLLFPPKVGNVRSFVVLSLVEQSLYKWGQILKEIIAPQGALRRRANMKTEALFPLEIHPKHLKYPFILYTKKIPIHFTLK